MANLSGDGDQVRPFSLLFPLSNSLADPVLLSQIKRSIVEQGEEGGRIFAAELHTFLCEQLGEEAEKTELVVFVVSCALFPSKPPPLTLLTSFPSSHTGQKAALGRSGFKDAFLRGLAASPHLTVVAAPQNGPKAFTERVKRASPSSSAPILSLSHLFPSQRRAHVDLSSPLFCLSCLRRLSPRPPRRQSAREALSRPAREDRSPFDGRNEESRFRPCRYWRLQGSRPSSFSRR
jgi:hypothetical protein